MKYLFRTHDGHAVEAVRIALPALTNDFVALLKDSSLVSVITVVELTKRMTIVAVDVPSSCASVACTDATASPIR